MEELKSLIIFSLLAAANLMVLFLILFFKKNNKLTNKVLGLLVFIPCVVLIVNSILYSESFSGYPFIVISGFSIAFLFGPLLLLYIYLEQGNLYQFKTKHLFHFLPFPMVVFYGLYVNLQSEELIQTSYSRIMSGEDVVINLIYLSQFIHFAIYITWGSRKVKLFKIKNKLTAFEEVNYKWLQFFVSKLLLINVLLFVVYVLQMTFYPSYIAYSDLLATPLISSCFYPMIVYKNLSNQIVPDEQSLKQKINKPISIHTKHKSLNIKEKEYLESLNNSSQLIQNYIEENKLYLKLDYTISDLSKEIELPLKLVSDTINHAIGKKFSDLMNDYRVEESKLMLIEKSNILTIDAIAEMSGFKSRATFYRAFKKTTNITPLQYIKVFKSVS